jgi:hypothetical protein
MTKHGEHYNSRMIDSKVHKLYAINRLYTRNVIEIIYPRGHQIELDYKPLGFWCDWDVSYARISFVWSCRPAASSV